MIILDSTDKSLEVLLDSAVSANEAVFSSNYVDISQTDFGVDAVSSNDGETNGTTAVTMISAPSADTSRQVKYLSIYNADTASIDVEVRINNNSTFRSIVNVTLSAGKTLQYTNDTGWQTADVNSLSVIESTLAGATDKDPFDDTDNIVGVDSGGSLIKNTWANFKTFLSNTYATLSGGNAFEDEQSIEFTSSQTPLKLVGDDAVVYVEAGSFGSGASRGGYIRLRDASGTVMALIDARTGEVEVSSLSLDGGVNVLDSLENTTSWTPALTFGGASTGITYTASTGGKYMEINGWVFGSGFLQLSDKGSATGDARIVDLPYVSGSDTPDNAAVSISQFISITFSGQFHATILENTDKILLAETSEAGSYSNLTDADFTNSSRIRFSFFYRKA